MAEDDDESFGDFTFASFPTNNSTNTKSIEDDNEWGDFVEYPSGSEPSTAPSLTQSKPFDPFGSKSEQSKKTSGWVKPCGALPLSLFGEDEEDKEKDTNAKIRNGSNPNLGYGFDSSISNLYNQDQKVKFENGSFSNSNKTVGLDSVNSNSKKSNGLSFDPNSGSPCVSRVQSLNYLASLNGDGQSSGLFSDSNSLSSSVNVSSSSFIMSNQDFDMSKSNMNGLNRTLSVDALTGLNDQGLQIKNKSSELVFELNVSSSSENLTSSSFGVWDTDFHMSKSNQSGLNRRTSSLDVGIGESSSAATVWNADINRSKSDQTGLNRTLSLDGLTNLNVQAQQIKTENGAIVPNSDVSSSSANASSSNFGGWDFDFGGVGSAIERSISSAGVGGLNSNFNAVENLDNAHNDNDDDEDGWEFKDAYSISEVGDNIKATSEAKKEHETNAFSFDFHNGLNGSVDLFATSNGSATSDSKAHHAGDMQAYSSGFDNSLNSSIDLFAMPSQPIDLFATCNGISVVRPDNIFGFDIKPSMASKNIHISASDGRGEQKESNGVLDAPVVESAESDEDFGEFTTAASDSGLKLEEEWKLNDVAHSELQASESDDKDQVKESKLENHKGALPLSIFGDEEELEIDGSSNIEDIFVPHNASYSKNDRSPDSNVSINDLISNLYSQAEHISPVRSAQVPNSISVSPQDSVSNSNLLNGEDELDDGEWEFKDGSSEMRIYNDISLLTFEDPPQRSFSNLNLDDYLNLYSKLRNKLCYHAKCHLDDFKRAQSIDGLPVEEAKISTLNKEIEEACKDFDQDNALCKGDHLEGHSSHNMGAFIEILQESKFQVLESEYHLSRRLSLVETDLETTVDLLRHATMMLKILRSGSLEEQSIYVSVWYKMVSVCVQELQHGSCIWKKILEMNAQSHMLSHPRGRAFLRALGEIYRVTVVLEASVKLCKPWLNSAQGTSIYSMLDECHAIWSSSDLGEALLSMLDSASSGDGSSVASLLDSIKLIHGLDALSLQKHLYAQKEVCRLSLLTLEVLPGMELIDWNGEHYFLTLANLWANLISSDPPELPQLINGW